MNHQPTTAFDCDPLSPITPIQTPSLLHINDGYTAPAPLTIPNLPSFLMDDWSQSSSPISQYDAYSNLSPVDSFDAHFTFDTRSFETLDLDCQQQQQHNNDAGAFGVTDSSIDNLSLGQQSEYDLGASAELHLLDMGMGGSNLVHGFDATQYLDLLAQPTCSQQRYQHQQPAFIPAQHHQPQQHHHHHIPSTNLDLDLSALISPQAEFVI